MMLTGTAQRARRLAAFLDYTPVSDDVQDESNILPLWCAVAEQAVEDIRSDRHDWQSEHYRDTAVAWFLDRHGVWAQLCDRFGWDLDTATKAALRDVKPATKRRASMPDTPSKIGRARAWIATQRDEWTRGRLANEMNLSKNDCDWIMNTLRIERSIEPSTLRGWWRAVRVEEVA